MTDDELKREVYKVVRNDVGCGVFLIFVLLFVTIIVGIGVRIDIYNLQDRVKVLEKK